MPLSRTVRLTATSLCAAVLLGAAGVPAATAAGARPPAKAAAKAGAKASAKAAKAAKALEKARTGARKEVASTLAGFRSVDRELARRTTLTTTHRAALVAARDATVADVRALGALVGATASPRTLAAVHRQLGSLRKQAVTLAGVVRAVAAADAAVAAADQAGVRLRDLLDAGTTNLDAAAVEDLLGDYAAAAAELSRVNNAVLSAPRTAPGRLLGAVHAATGTVKELTAAALDLAERAKAVPEPTEDETTQPSEGEDVDGVEDAEDSDNAEVSDQIQPVS